MKLLIAEDDVKTRSEILTITRKYFPRITGEGLEDSLTMLSHIMPDLCLMRSKGWDADFSYVARAHDVLRHVGFILLTEHGYDTQGNTLSRS
jgi:hypothetical protein